MDLAAPGNEIKVAIRVRPLLPKEQVTGIKSRWQCTEKMISPDSSQSSNVSYIFDRVFDENATNRMVYEELASDIVKQAMIGFNGTLFTYGQSGSGKTYTIDALRTFAIKSAYDYIENCPAREFLMRVSYIELYNEKLTDLLSDASTTLTIREDYEKNVYIDGLQEIIVKSQDHVKDVLTQGNARRTFAETRLNERSSRAHCIFRLVIESREREDPEHSSVYVSYLNLVDLAGSERAGENSGERLREGVSINLSLLTLSQVIRKLSGDQREFINYRDSKLTRILQNALEGNSKTAILCTVAPFSVEETHSTLRFALNAKKVKTKPQQNEVLTDSAMLKKSQLEISKLKNRIKELEERNLVQDDDELHRRREEREHLIKEFSSFLCVSSKAREEKRGFDKKRRETVCVPQMYRSVDFKVPRLPVNIPKVEFPNPPPKQMDSFTISQSPPANDSVFSVSHSLDSPCNEQECSYCDLSFTGFEQAIVQESVIQRYKTKLKKYEAQIADLNRKLKGRSGLFVTCRRDIQGIKSSGSEFLNPTFCEEGEEEVMSEEEYGGSKNGRLDEDVENMFEENETLKSQNVLYKNEIEGLKKELEMLTVKFSQYDERREESEKNIAELSNRIKRDEEEIKKFKSREGEIVRQYEEDMKRWQEKVENLEWERKVQEIMKEEKGLLETSSIDKHDTSGRDLHEDLEMQKKELLNEWEEMGRLKEELNKQAISIENTLCVMEKDKERLQKEKDRIDREWNDLEKANDDLRKEKEDFDKKQESAGSERLQEAMNTTLGNDVDRRTEIDHVGLENHMSITSKTEGQVSSLVEGRYAENIILNEEKEALLQELDSLRQSVCELNARKSALESEMANCTVVKCKDGVECLLPEKTDVPGADRLQKEWEILRDAQKQLKDREMEISELEAVSERMQDRCCMLEELNERLEEELEKLRVSQFNKETVDDTDMAKQGNSLQDEWKKLTKYQAELSKQEENVERKIERLCMLEEEKEQFEEEKNEFYREKECLREAEVDLRKARDAFKQEQLKIHQELEEDKEGDMGKENQILKEEKRLHEQLEHLRQVKEQFDQEKEAFEQRKSDQARDQETLNKEWCILKQAQNELRIEKQTLEMKKVDVERSDLSGRDAENVGRFKDNLSQLDDESGIVTATSWDNSSLCSEFKDGSENLSACIQEKMEQTLQEMKEEGHEQWENIKEDGEGMNIEMLSEGGDERLTCLEACEDSQSFQGKLTRKRTDYTEQVEDVGKEGLALQSEEEEERYTLGKLQTLQDEVGKLQLEKEQLFNEKVLFHTEKEQLQELIDALQRENKMLKEDPQLDKKGRLDICSAESMLNEIETFIPNERNKELQNEWENLKWNEKNFGREILLCEGDISLKEENQRLQTQIENLKQCLQQNQMLQIDPKQNLQDVRENMGTQDIKQIIETEHHVADITVNNFSLNVQNEPAGIHFTDLEPADLNEQDTLDETVRIAAGLSQSVWDISRYTEDSCNGEDNAEVCDLMTELKTAGFFTYEKKDMFDEEKDTFKKEEDTLNKEKEMFNEDKDTFSKEKDTFNKEEETFNKEKDTFNEKKDTFNKDTFNENNDTFNQDKDTFIMDKDTFKKEKDSYDQNKSKFDKEKLSLHEEWEKLKQAEEQLFNKEAALQALEKDIAQRSDVLHKFEAEQKILHQSTDHLKQAEDILSRQQEELKTLEDNIKAELVRLLALQKEREIIQYEVEKLIENKIVLEKVEGKLQDQQDICQETNADFHLDRKTCENDMQMTEEEKNNMFQEDKERLQMEKSKLEEAIAGLQQQQARCQVETEIFQEEKDRLQEEKNRLREETERLQEETERLQEAVAGLQQQQARCQVETEIFQEEKERLHEEKERYQQAIPRLQEHQARCQEEIEIFQEENSKLQEEKVRLNEEEKNNMFQEDNERLQMEKSKLEEAIAGLQQQQARCQVETEIFQEEKDRLQEETERLQEAVAGLQQQQARCQVETEIFQEEKDRLQEEKDRLQEEKDRLHEEKERLHEVKERYQEAIPHLQEHQARCQEEIEIFQEDNSKLQEEKVRLNEEEKNMFQEDNERLQMEKSKLEEAIAGLQQQQARCQVETEIFQEEKDRLQEETERLQEAVAGLQQQQARCQVETEIFQEEKDRLQEEKDRLHEAIAGLQEHQERCQKQMEKFQEEKDRLQEEKVRLQEAIAGLQKHQARCQKEMKIFREDNGKLQEEKVLLREEKDRLKKEEDRLQEQQEINQAKYTDFQSTRQTWGDDIELIEIEKNKLQTEEDLMKEKKMAGENDPEICYLKNFLDQGRDTLFVAQQEHVQKEEELEMKKAAVQIEEERIEKEKEMLETMKISLYEEAEKLKADKEMIQQERARLQQEQEIIEMKKTDFYEEQERLQKDIDEKQAMHQKEKETWQHERETLEELKAILHEEQVTMQTQKELFKERNLDFEEKQERLEKEKEIIEQNIVLVHEQEEKLSKEKIMLEKEIDTFQREQNEFQIKVQVFEQNYRALQEMQDALHKEKEMFENEKMTIQSEKERFREEKKLFEEKYVLFQVEKSTLEEAIASLQEQQARCQNEMEIFWEEKDRLQGEKIRLQDEKGRLHETITDLQQQQTRLQKDTEILQEEKDKLQEEKDKLQKEKDRIQEAEVNFHKKWENFQIENNNTANYREELNEKERLIDNKMTHLANLEKEKERFQSEWDKLEKAREDLKHERLSLNERMMQHEEEKRRLREEWDNVQQSLEDLKEKSILFQEKKINFEAELQAAWENVRQVQDKVMIQEEEVRKKYAEIEEKMQAVLEQERTANDKESQSAHQTATDSQLSPEELMENLQKVEDDLEDAYEKIDRLENLITRGKAILAEKTEAAREANDRIKELEEAIEALKSNLASLNSNLEAKSSECEKLKKSLDNYRTAAREQEVLKKEMEAMIRGRTKDRECYEDTIRQLNLKLRDKQNAETSFFVQRETPSDYAPSLDQMRKIVEFENAAKFLELNQLKHGVQEQKTKIADLENEKSQLQAEIKKLQLLLDNESVKSEAMKSTANQAIHARRKVEEELVQLKKQLGKGAKESMEETPDEVTKMLKNQLQEKDQLIDQLSKSLDSRNMRWNAVALRHKNLIEENYSLQKLVAEHQKQSVDSATHQAQCNVVKDDDRMHKEKQTHIADLVKENSELKASVEKLKLEFHQQTASKKTNLRQLQNQSRSAESLSDLSTQTENSQLAQQPQPTAAFSVPTFRSGGAVESFVIAVKDREIRDFKKKLEKQSAKITDLEKEKSQLQAELTKLQLLLDNGTVKSGSGISTANQTRTAKQKVEDELVQQSKQSGKGAKQSTEETSAEATKMLKNQRQEKDRLFDQLMKSIDSSSARSNTVTPRPNSCIEETHGQQKLGAESQNESTGFTKLQTRWNAIKNNESLQTEKQTQLCDQSEEKSELKEALKAVEQNTNPNSQKLLRSEVKQQPEEHRHRRFQVNSTDKENIPFGM